LTPRQKEVFRAKVFLQNLIEYYSREMVAEFLGISPKTYDNHIAEVWKKIEGNLGKYQRASRFKCGCVRCAPGYHSDLAPHPWRYQSKGDREKHLPFEPLISEKADPLSKIMELKKCEMCEGHYGQFRELCPWCGASQYYQRPANNKVKDSIGKNP
jgi:hypothetical protein